jgi:hypothetical protein
VPVITACALAPTAKRRKKIETDADLKFEENLNI